MYKGKPLIISNRPWWRHHIFKWGWYSLSQDDFELNEVINADGYHKPNDDGGGKFKHRKYDENHMNDGILIIPINEDKSWIRQYEEEDNFNVELFGSEPDGK